MNTDIRFNRFQPWYKRIVHIHYTMLDSIQVNWNSSLILIKN